MAATKARKPQQATATPANTTPATTLPLYTLNAKAQALAAAQAAAGNTLQAPVKGLGLAWRQAGYKAPNTRALALAAVLAGCYTQFTALQAQAALVAAKASGTVNLGSGTPGSYVKAFIANGYFAPVAA